MVTLPVVLVHTLLALGTTPVLRLVLTFSYQVTVEIVNRDHLFALHTLPSHLALPSQVLVVQGVVSKLSTGHPTQLALLLVFCRGATGRLLLLLGCSGRRSLFLSRLGLLVQLVQVGLFHPLQLGVVLSRELLHQGLHHS